MAEFNPLDPLGLFASKDGQAVDFNSQVNSMIESRRAELLAQGYPGGVVNMAMTWARNSADGMADYVSASDEQFPGLFIQFLDKYLAEAEKYIKGLVGDARSNGV